MELYRLFLQIFRCLDCESLGILVWHDETFSQVQIIVISFWGHHNLLTLRFDASGLKDIAPSSLREIELCLVDVEWIWVNWKLKSFPQHYVVSYVLVSLSILWKLKEERLIETSLESCVWTLTYEQELRIIVPYHRVLLVNSLFHYVEVSETVLVLTHIRPGEL